jgi:hypothetical protein
MMISLSRDLRILPSFNMSHGFLIEMYLAGVHIGRSGQGSVGGEWKVASALHDWFGDMFAPSALQSNAHR